MDDYMTINIPVLEEHPPPLQGEGMVEGIEYRILNIDLRMLKFQPKYLVKGLPPLQGEGRRGGMLKQNLIKN